MSSLSLWGLSGVYWQGENHDRRQARSAKEGRHGPRRRCDILLSIQRVTDHAAADAAAGVEAIEDVARIGIEGEEVVIEIAGEQDAAGGCRDAGDERRGRGIFPALLAGRCVERGEPALRFLARV